MIKGKKAAVEHFVSFALAFVILMIFWLLIKVTIAVGWEGKALTGLDLESRDMPASGACDYILLNFLRSDGVNGMSPAEMLTFSQGNFTSYTTRWFKLNYDRGNPRLLKWRMEVSSGGMPFLVAGELGIPNDKFSCTQTVPSKNKNYVVRLWLEY